MRPRKPIKRAKAPERLLQHQRAILAAVTTNERQNAWAQELLGRRNAVAPLARSDRLLHLRGDAGSGRVARLMLTYRSRDNAPSPMLREQSGYRGAGDHKAHS